MVILTDSVILIKFSWIHDRKIEVEFTIDLSLQLYLYLKKNFILSTHYKKFIYKNY